VSDLTSQDLFRAFVIKRSKRCTVPVRKPRRRNFLAKKYPYPKKDTTKKKSRYFTCFFALALATRDLNFSTRPAVSRTFSCPV
jgi:hypothetical protein